MARKRTTQQYYMYMRQETTKSQNGKDGHQIEKCPTPTQFDGTNPQFNEWAGKVKAYLTIHNAYYEDYMDKSTKSIETLNISDIQDDYTAQISSHNDQRERTLTTMTSTMTCN
eukprot:4607205-Amphidinium_carterae.1